MKKMFMIFMAFTMAAGLFAYEPKKECAKVKRNRVQYLEHCTRRGCCNEGIHHKWTYNTKSGKFTYMYCCSFDSMWCWLLGNRRRYDSYLETAKYKDEKCSTCDFLEMYKSAYENNELNETEMKQYESMLKLHQATSNLKGVIEGKPTHAKTATKSYYELCANEQKKESVNKIPFVTEENWKTITREELLYKIRTFAEEVRNK